jgi:hypothetical protein
MCSATNVGQSRARIACLILGKLLLYLRLFSEYYLMTVYENCSYHQDKCRVGKRISKDTISCQFKLSQGRIEDNRYTVVAITPQAEQDCRNLLIYELLQYFYVAFRD